MTLSFAGRGVWGDITAGSKCAWRLQGLHLCIWPDRQWQDIHYDGASRHRKSWCHSQSSQPAVWGVWTDEGARLDLWDEGSHHTNPQTKTIFTFAIVKAIHLEWFAISYLQAKRLPVFIFLCAHMALMHALEHQEIRACCCKQDVSS